MDGRTRPVSVMPKAFTASEGRPISVLGSFIGVSGLCAALSVLEHHVMSTLIPQQKGDLPERLTRERGDEESNLEQVRCDGVVATRRRCEVSLASRPGYSSMPIRWQGAAGQRWM